MKAADGAAPRIVCFQAVHGLAMPGINLNQKWLELLAVGYPDKFLETLLELDCVMLKELLREDVGLDCSWLLCLLGL